MNVIVVFSVFMSGLIVHGFSSFPFLAEPCEITILFFYLYIRLITQRLHIHLFCL